MDLLPQEIEVWYILPSIRKELAVGMMEKGYKQKHIAKILGITEAAISQYKSSKRASFVDLTDGIKKRIAEIVEKVSSRCPPEAFDAKNESCNYSQKRYQEIQKLLDISRDERLVCDIHRKLCGADSKCVLCFEE